MSTPPWYPNPTLWGPPLPPLTFPRAGSWPLWCPSRQRFQPLITHFSKNTWRFIDDRKETYFLTDKMTKIPSRGKKWSYLTTMKMSSYPILFNHYPCNIVTCWARMTNGACACCIGAWLWVQYIFWYNRSHLYDDVKIKFLTIYERIYDYVKWPATH